eukprot:m.304690 g.304690  ORF g.304690 m.304690 type:complete len:279 (+) comp17190_c0_seq1:192-1028(+)
MASLRVAAVQQANEHATTPAQREANVAAACALIREAHAREAQPAQLYVLPELSAVGYDDCVMAAAAALAEDPSSGPTTSAFCALASELSCWISFGFVASTPRGLCIANGVVGPDGPVDYYEKMHVCQYGDCREKDAFVPGSAMPKIWRLGNFSCAVVICYDIRFSKVFQRLGEQGVDLILHPGGWPRDASFASWHSFVVTRAVETQCYIVSVNRAGSHNGSSIICPPFVNYGSADPDSSTIELGTEEAILFATVKQDKLVAARTTYPFRNDARPDLYN